MNTVLNQTVEKSKNADVISSSFSVAAIVSSPLILTLISSLLLSFALRPWGSGVIALLAFVPLMIALQLESNPWRCALWTYLTAMGGVLVALEGLALEYPWVFALGVLGYGAAFALVGPIVHLFKSRFGTRVVLLFPLIWVSVEFLVGQPALLGSWANPIMTVGYTQWNTPLLQAARWSGASGVSLLVLLINAGLAYFLLEVSKRKASAFVPLSLIITITLVSSFAPAPTTTAKGQPFKAGIAQAHLPTLEYTIADFDGSSQQLIINRYKPLMERLKQQKADLIVLPETAFGGWYADLERNEILQDALSGVPLALVGLKTQQVKEDGQGVVGRNAIVEWQREARRVREVYAKRNPIPVTEAGFDKGKHVGLVMMGGVKFGLGICWENTFSGLARETALAGAEVLVYQNSLLWAGATATPILHQRISAFRAVETGRDVIHATAGGASAIIDSSGRVISSAALTLETAIVGMVQPRVGITAYLLLGNWVSWLCVSVTSLLLLLSKFKLPYRRQNIIASRGNHT
jgi:apolipoprotein N-acyltransferase